MSDMADIFEQDLEAAFEVRDKKSVHRFSQLLARTIVGRREYDRDMGTVHTEIRTLTEAMKKGFERMDQRFEDANKRFDDVNRRFEDVSKRFDDVNKRFDDVNQRFTMMFAFITIGFTVITATMVVFKFLA